MKYEVHIYPGEEPRLETFEPPKPATASLSKLVRAREVARAATPLGHQPVNVVVFPGTVVGEQGTFVYALAATGKANTVVLGKHFRVFVPERGGPASVTPLSDAELEISSVAADGSHLESFSVTHFGGAYPNEAHVFAAMMSDSHLVVTTSAGVWSVAAPAAEFQYRWPHRATMPDTPQTELRFFVYVVESPSAPDLYHGRSEATLVAQAAALDLVPCVTRTAITREAFDAALTIGLPEAMKQFPERFPILHLSAHGGTTGLQLSNNDTVSWQDLRQLVRPINESLGGNLLVCMSACKGYSACQMAMQSDDSPHPYFALVANHGTPTWSDTAVAYSAFYHLLAKGSKVVDAVEAMKAASGDEKWVSETAEEAKQGWLDYLKEVDLPKAQEELEQAGETADLPPNAKALEHSTSG